ncbi:MAG: type 1 glutamine amidotransferase-like domain-containing protein [Pyrinomonadaceae bacterium]|nr:type 1 glutamine amidotransferase-like domain-containing protein [Pyrinomonadaceae bacterium]
MKRIFYGIGGGNMRDEKMAAHYPRIVELARSQFGVRNPNVSIFPTAHLNGINEKMGRGWMDFIVEEFERLGCEVRNIWIGDLSPEQKGQSNSEVVKQLGESEIVFVLGGDTRYLLEVVRERGLVEPIIQSFEAGTVFAGTSAGLIWFTGHCLSDSESFHKDEWDYVMLKGLGVFPFAVNVHDNGAVPDGIIDTRSRKEQFEEEFLGLRVPKGITVDEMVGIEIIDGVCSVSTADPAIGVELLKPVGGKVIRKRLEPGENIDLFDDAAWSSRFGE